MLDPKLCQQFSVQIPSHNKQLKTKHVHYTHAWIPLKAQWNTSGFQYSLACKQLANMPTRWHAHFMMTQVISTRWHAHFMMTRWHTHSMTMRWHAHFMMTGYTEVTHPLYDANEVTLPLYDDNKVTRPLYDDTGYMFGQECTRTGRATRVRACNSNRSLSQGEIIEPY